MKQKEPNFLQSKFKSPSHKLHNTKGNKDAEKDDSKGRKPKGKSKADHGRWVRSNSKGKSTAKRKRSIKSGKTILYTESTHHLHFLPASRLVTNPLHREKLKSEST